MLPIQGHMPIVPQVVAALELLILFECLVAKLWTSLSVSSGHRRVFLRCTKHCCCSCSLLCLPCMYEQPWLARLTYDTAACTRHYAIAAALSRAAPDLVGRQLATASTTALQSTAQGSALMRCCCWPCCLLAATPVNM